MAYNFCFYNKFFHKMHNIFTLKESHLLLRLPIERTGVYELNGFENILNIFAGERVPTPYF